MNNKIAVGIFFICVTIAAIFFEDPTILWMWLLGIIFI